MLIFHSHLNWAESGLSKCLGLLRSTFSFEKSSETSFETSFHEGWHKLRTPRLHWSLILGTCVKIASQVG